MPHKKPRTKSHRSVGGHTPYNLEIDGQNGSLMPSGYCGHASNLGSEHEDAPLEQHRHDYDYGNEESELEEVQPRTVHHFDQHQSDSQMTLYSHLDAAGEVEVEAMDGSGSSDDAPMTDSTPVASTLWLDYLHSADGPYVPDLSFAYQSFDSAGSSDNHSQMGGGLVSESEEGGDDDNNGEEEGGAASQTTMQLAANGTHGHSFTHWSSPFPNMVAAGAMQTSPSSVVTPATPTEIFPIAFGPSTSAGSAVPPASATHNTAVFHAEADEPFGQEQLPTFLGPHVPTMLGSVNMGLAEFLDQWANPDVPTPQTTRPDRFHLLLETSKQLTKVRRAHLKGDRCDFQGINWRALGVTRQLARTRRARTFQNYTSWPGSDDYPLGASVQPRPGPTLLRDEEPFLHSAWGLASGSYFRFREMHIRHDTSLAHFQLRSSLASPFRSQIYYASRLGISKVDPVTGNHERSLQWTDFPVFGRAITTLGANQDVLVAGSFTGEYIISSLHSTDIHNFIKGTITEAASGITNHLQVHKQRSTSNAVASICSNDNGFRVLDLETQQFVSEFGYGFALNCSAVSPDCRLRVVVGDSKDVTIANAETGDPEVLLKGHDDFGFACDWSDDGRYLATGFQDKTIKIWDPRKWKDGNGTSTPLQHLRTDLAGARGLMFSPLGSGESVLAAAEEADLVHVYSTHAFGRETRHADTRQTLSVFGELGGVDFAEGGQELNVLVADSQRGGILQLERCGTRRDITDAIPLF